MAYSARNSPLAFVSKGWQMDLKAGGVRRNRALGEFTLGTTAMLGVTSLAFNGLLTGRAPTDPGKRALFYEEGYQPYSLKVGNRWVSFLRMEPFATHFAVIADVKDAIAEASVSDEAEIASIMGAITIAFVESTKNRAFFEGFEQMIEAANGLTSSDEQERKLFKKTMHALTVSMTPFSSLVNEQRQARDNVLREANTLIDRFMDEIPGYSENLPARRSWLTGEPMSYSSNPVLNIYPSSTVKGDELVGLMMKYNTPLTPPNQTLKAGVELSDEQYSRLLRLNGQIQLEGKTLKQSLLEVFNGFDTSTLDKELSYLQGNDEYARETPLYKELNGVRSRYLKAAEAQLIRENPDMIEEIRTKLIEKGNVQEGMSWMNSPLFEALGFEEQEKILDDPQVSGRKDNIRKKSNKALKKMMEDPGPPSYELDALNELVQ